MGLVDDYLSAYKVGKKEQMAARMAFFISGFAVATWAPMIPAVKDKLQIGADILGMLLLSIGISAFIFMPLAGMLSRSYGCKKVLRTAIAVMAADLIILSLLGNIWGFLVFLAVFGAAMGCIDVNMNLNAVIVENASKKRMMSGMHALWSVGCFAGAGLFSLLGDKIVAVLGEEKTLVFGSVIGAIGFLSVIFLENFYAIQLGFVLMGLGLANIVPTIYSLTKYQKVMPINAAVTAITSMGYTGVILGPAVLGFVAHGFGITQVFYLLAVLLAAQAVAVKYYFAKMG